MRTLGAAIGLFALLGASLIAQSAPPGKLNGSVVDASDNVMPGVTIALRGPESRSTVTDSKGAFTFTALPLGDYELRASLIGFSTVVLKLTVEETMPPLTIRMRLARSSAEIILLQTGQRVGTVRDASGAALPGVHVEVASPTLVEKYRVTTTSADGRFRIVNLPVGSYSVTFSRAGFWTHRRDNVALTTDLVTTVDATVRIGGHID